MPAYPSPHHVPTLVSLGWDDQWAIVARAAAETDPRLAAARPGRIARVDRGRAVVLTHQAEPVRVASPADTVTGDWVLVGTDTVRPLPRRTELVRGAGRRDTRPQPLAANGDLVFVLAALSSAPNLARLDRMVTIAWNSGAQPVIVLTKADLSPTAASERAEVAEYMPDVPVYLTSTADGRGLDDLRTHLGPGRTAALLGMSGVGKSSLVNALAGTRLAVADIRADGRGRHTTTRRDLVVAPDLGVFIDTPGLRGVQLWDAASGMDQTFADIDALAADCRYPDCGHDGEPDCAVARAVAEGRLAPRRLESMRKLQRELAWLQGRYDARLRAEQRRRWRLLVRQHQERRR